MIGGLGGPGNLFTAKPFRMKQRIVMTGVEKEAKQLYEELKKCSITPLDDGKGGPKLVRVDGGESDPDEKLRIEIEVTMEDPQEGSGKKFLADILNLQLPPLNIPSPPHPFPEKLRRTFAHRTELIKPRRTWSVCCGVFKAVVKKLTPTERAAFVKSKGRGSILRLVKEASNSRGARTNQPRIQRPERPKKPTLDWSRVLDNHLDSFNLIESHEKEIRRLFHFLVSIRSKLYLELLKNPGVVRQVAKFFQGDNVGVEEGAWLVEKIIRWMVTQAHMVRAICALICVCSSKQDQDKDKEGHEQKSKNQE